MIKKKFTSNFPPCFKCSPTMRLFLCGGGSAALFRLSGDFFGRTGHHRRVGLSVGRRAAVRRKRCPRVESLSDQLLRLWLLLWACHFPFASFARTRSSGKSRQPGGSSSPLVVGICGSLALSATSLDAYVVLIPRSASGRGGVGRVFLAAAAGGLGTVSLRRSLSARPLVGRRFGSSGLRLFD